MVNTIKWTPKAEETYLAIITHIFETWTAKEVEEFEQLVSNLLKRIKKFNEHCPPSQVFGLRKCTVSSQTSLIYQIKNDNVELLAFIDNRSEHAY